LKLRIAKRVRDKGNRRGIVLLITLVVLVVLASIGYTLTTRVAAQLHRDQYIMDYQNARYACDSGLKYALSSLDNINVKPIERPNDPDFSDLFAFSDEQYKRFLTQWADAHRYQQVSESSQDVCSVPTVKDSNLAGILNRDANGSNMVNNLGLLGAAGDYSQFSWSDDPNNMVVPGPYGPPWPLVIKPVEFEIGSAKVTIEIEDENAKLPLIWGTNGDKDKQREVDAAMNTFCEWMNMNAEQVDVLKRGLKEIGDVKTYKAGTTEIVAPGQTPADKEPNVANARSLRRSRRRLPPRSPQALQVRSSNAQLGDFIRLMHSSKIDIEPLAQPYVKTQQRTESILKYIDRWGATQVNVNTAPRQVLEAVFMFGGDAPDVADAIIKARQKQPFASIDDLQKRVYKYADSIKKSGNFITTTSKVFAVKITAVSGTAKVSTTAAVLSDGKKSSTIAILSE
jgi:hypothetical protein